MVFLSRLLVFVGLLACIACTAGVYYAHSTVSPPGRLFPPPEALYVAPQPGWARPASCPVTGESFCRLLGYPAGHAACSFDPAWLNAACQLDCDATLDAYRSIGALPGRVPTVGLLRAPGAADRSVFHDAAHNAACRLGTSLQSQSLTFEHEHKEGLRNLLFSMGDCIRQRYNCG